LPFRWLSRPLAALALTVSLAGCVGDGKGSGNSDFDPQAVYKQASPSVVTVFSILSRSGGSLGGGRAGEGAGFVVSEGGEVVTNAHVITKRQPDGSRKAAEEIYVDLGAHRVAAEVVGFDPHADLALLEVDPKGLGLEPLDLAGADQPPEVGQRVAAIGSPFGAERSLSVGVVSATDRSIKSLTRFEIDRAIQTDASINPGNSGGPLLDAKARVIGVNQSLAGSGGGAGVGFAVPVSVVRRSLEQLREDGSVEYSYVGVVHQQVYPELADHLNLDTDTGVLVTDLFKGSPAEAAGLRAGQEEIRYQGLQITTGGDVILAIDGRELDRDHTVSAAIADKRPGEEISLEVLRDGERIEIRLKLGIRPLRPQT
jgi:S1-C subfamily serine protease